ncbi:hypothetical protein J5Y04_31455 [Kitasatospora sp. RG8]|uniref:hypothetical protein n=1 Tax=Kitasatospora sp. RG8 TaxID=2820815 RepID=UPI001AE05715|nr:hypothetical protein [Kitasatospora sp. RG8]MBP0454024.1 hypothetical protein [Kitasatospora sp. RG8]
MADEVGAGPERAPMVWALAVRESAAGAPFAEVIVEVGPRLHGDLIENVVDSGFVLAAGDPPDTTAVVEMRGDLLARLVLVGGRQVWEPASPVVASSGWLSAAGARGGAVVMVVPPGTWPPGLMNLAPQERIDVFTRRLEEAREVGLVLHGIATLDTGPADR